MPRARVCDGAGIAGRPSVWLVSAAWGRYAVTRLALAQRAHLVGELAGRGIDAHAVIVADDANLEIAREHGFATVEMGNDYLGARFNAGIRYACVEGNADYVVHIGSDDWAHPDLFDDLAGPLVVGTGRRIALVDLEHGVAQVCHVRGQYGVIPWILPRAVLEPSGFEPCLREQLRGIDGSLVRGLTSRPEWRFHDPHDLARVDFKSAVNITSYSALRSIATGVEIADPWARLAEIYPADLVTLARETHELLAGKVAA